MEPEKLKQISEKVRLPYDIKKYIGIEWNDDEWPLKLEERSQLISEFIVEKKDKFKKRYSFSWREKFLLMGILCHYLDVNLSKEAWLVVLEAIRRDKVACSKFWRLEDERVKKLYRFAQEIKKKMREARNS